MEVKPEGEGSRARIGQQSLGTGVLMVLGRSWEELVLQQAPLGSDGPGRSWGFVLWALGSRGES